MATAVSCAQAGTPGTPKIEKEIEMINFLKEVMKSYSFGEYLAKIAAITLAVGGLIAVLLALALR